MPDDDERERKVQKFLAKKYEPYIEFAKKLLFEKVNNVVISNRLTTEPCVVVADTYGHSSFMDKIQRAQMFAGANQDNPLQDFKKILEINPHHRVNQIILERINVLLFIFSNKKQLKRLRNLWNYYMRLLPSIQDLRPRTQMSLLRDFIKFILRLWEWLAWRGKSCKLERLIYRMKTIREKMRRWLELILVKYRYQLERNDLLVLS